MQSEVNINTLKDESRIIYSVEMIRITYEHGFTNTDTNFLNLASAIIGGVAKCY